MLWVLAATSLVVGLSVVVGFAVGGNLVVVKQILFVVGFLLFGLGSLGIQPKAPYRDSKRITVEGSSSHRLEDILHELPPLQDTDFPFERRISRNVKILVTGLLVLCVSAFLEFGLGVAVGS